jgi:hypothetical protein
MVATCVVLGYEQWRLKVGENQDELFAWYFNIHLLFSAPLDGACYAGVVLCLWRFFRGGPAFPIEPGHWFLLVRGGELLVGAAWDYVHSFLSEEQLNALPRWFWIVNTVVFLGLVSLLAIVAAAKTRGGSLWRLAFLAIAASKLSAILRNVLSIAIKGRPWFLNEFAWSLGSRVLFSLPALFAVLGAISDWRRNERRDFLHWAGVTVAVLRVALEWPTWITWQILFR